MINRLRAALIVYPMSHASNQMHDYVHALGAGNDCARHANDADW
jgi:hypothetical protein